jgi:hypothetical protein
MTAALGSSMPRSQPGSRRRDTAGARSRREDFNADGRPDFVLGNAGLNTPYHVGNGRSAVMLVGDFRPDADPVLIEAERDGNELFPGGRRSNWRRSCRRCGGGSPRE